jgi:hypothetical protein
MICEVFSYSTCTRLRAKAGRSRMYADVRMKLSSVSAVSLDPQVAERAK